MKRTFQQKVEPVSCHLSDTNTVLGQPKLTSLGISRKVRTSAAMIGLALSMGASSLLLPRQDDRAVAAEPLNTEAIFSAGSPKVQASSLASTTTIDGSVPATAPVTGPVINHRVREGQTLWQLARRYQVSINAIASVSGIAPNAVLRVGQVVKIPVSSRSLNEVRVIESREVGSGSVSRPTPTIASTTPNLDSTLKAQRDNSLNHLRQERDKLRSSLYHLETAPVVSENPVSARGRTGVVVPSVISSETPASATVQSTEASSSEPDASIVHSPSQFSDWMAYRLNLEAQPEASPLSLTRESTASGNRLDAADEIDDSSFSNVPRVPTSNSVTETIATAPVAPNLPPLIVESEVVRNASTTVHPVALGETVAQIARIYGISREAVIEANQLRNPNLIFVGQVLRIPSQPSVSVDSSADAPLTNANIFNSPVPATSNASPETVTHSLTSTIQFAGAVVVPTVPTVATNPPAATTVASTDLLAVGSLDVNPPTSGTEQGLGTLNAVPPSSPVVSSKTQPDADVQTNRFVENLISEIITLRERHLVTSSTPVELIQQPADPESIEHHADLPEATGETAVNPQFRRNRTLALSDAGVPLAQSPLNESAPGSMQAPPVVAVAPLGSENYDPLIQPITGQMVAPNLPPLPGAEAFLPSATIAFNGYIWPSRGVLTSGYGWRWGRMHRGIDIGAPVGTPVYAAAAGVVIFSGWNSGGYGNMVEVRHADGSMTRYAHHSRNLVRVGQDVTQGQQIAEVGSTGYSTGPHLHFEVHLPNRGTVNPMAYLPR